MYYISLPGKGAGFEVEDANVHIQVEMPAGMHTGTRTERGL